MDINVDAVYSVIGNNNRFVSPLKEPYSYYCFDDEDGTDIENNTKELLELYLEKLQYASEHAAELIGTAFQPFFYQFYGCRKDKLNSADEMCERLIFDSFVLYIKEREIGACLSNVEFMSGHFIECRWDDEWNLKYSGIC